MPTNRKDVAGNRHRACNEDQKTDLAEVFLRRTWFAVVRRDHGPCPSTTRPRRRARASCATISPRSRSSSARRRASSSMAAAPASRRACCLRTLDLNTPRTCRSISRKSTCFASAQRHTPATFLQHPRADQSSQTSRRAFRAAAASAVMPLRNVVYFPGSTIGNFESKDISTATLLACDVSRSGPEWRRFADRRRPAERPGHHP